MIHRWPSAKPETLSIPGVAEVDLFRAIDISYNDKPVVLATGDFSVLSQYGNLVIKSGPPAQELDQWMVGHNRAIVSEAFSLKHKVKKGKARLFSPVIKGERRNRKTGEQQNVEH